MSKGKKAGYVSSSKKLVEWFGLIWFEVYEGRDGKIGDLIVVGFIQ